MARSVADSDPYLRALAETYSHPSYEESWVAVDDYRRVQAYRETHPDAGPTEVARAFDLPSGRVRGWLGDTKPDVVRAVETAQERGWLPFSPGTDRGRGLTGLCTWIYAGGSISSGVYRPLFSVGDDDERAWLLRLGAKANVELTQSRSGEDRRGEEFRVSEDAAVLGRVLAALGCPVGDKTQSSTLTLPRYLSDAPERTRQVFVVTYLRLRAYPDTTTRQDRLRFKEHRSYQYFCSLVDLFSEVLDAGVKQNGYHVILSSAATDAYRKLDPL